MNNQLVMIVAIICFALMVIFKPSDCKSQYFSTPVEETQIEFKDNYQECIDSIRDPSNCFRSDDNKECAYLNGTKAIQFYKKCKNKYIMAESIEICRTRASEYYIKNQKNLCLIQTGDSIGHLIDKLEQQDEEIYNDQ